MGIATSPLRFREKMRSSARIPLSVPIVIRGKDAAGKSFIEKTATLLVNRRGAKVETRHSLVLGARLVVAIPHRKRVCPAIVVWSGTLQNEHREIGIDLGQPGDFWGVPLPEDTLAFRLNLTITEQDSSLPTPPPAEASGPELAQPVPAAPAPRPFEAHPEMTMDNTDKLASALQELTHAAIERSLGEALPQFHREAENSLREMQSALLEQTRERLDRVLQDALGQMEIRVTQEVARNRETLEQSLQGLVQASQQRLEASLTEYQERLATSAGIVRRELAHTLADLSGALNRG